MEKLSKNFMWMAASNIVASLFSIILFIYLARALAPVAFGYISYVFTLIFFLANFIDMGLSTYGTREVAKNRPLVSNYVSEIVSLRFFIAAIIVFFLTGATFMSSHSPILKALIFESAFILFIFAFATEWAFQGLEEMHMVFISFTVTSVLQVGLIYLFVKSPADLFRAPILYLAATLPIITVYLARLRFGFKMKMADFKTMIGHLSGAFVIWLISLCVQVYNVLDIFILGLFRPLQEVGYFTVSRRVTGTVAVFMLFLAGAMLPRLSASFCLDKAGFRDSINKFLKMAAGFTVVILVPLGLFNKYLITVTVGAEYLPASLPLSIMTIGLVLILFNLPYSTALIACGREKDVLRQAGACAGLSLILNFILMPIYGMIGASVSFVIVEAVALLWIILVYKKGGIDGREKRV
ncbi:MAG: flippase [Candidatus Omnitrophota bacterium]